MESDDATRSSGELDDDGDRTELRGRYQVLLQEMRVVLPGVQVLLAFLLTAPFASGYDKLDPFGRTLFGVALMSALAAVVLLMFPVILHRVGERTARSDRLVWGVRAAVIGFGMLAVSLTTSVWAVARFAFGRTSMLWIPIVALAMFVAVWAVLPRLVTRQSQARPTTRSSRSRQAIPGSGEDR